MDYIIPSINSAVTTGGGRSGRNVKPERDFLRCRERKVLERFWPRISSASVSSSPLCFESAIKKERDMEVKKMKEIGLEIGFEVMFW